MAARNSALGMAALFGLLFGPLVLFLGVRNLEGALSARHWTPAPALITSSEVLSGAGRDRSIHAAVRYSYQFNGAFHQNDRIRYGLFLTRKSADRVAARYRPGDTVMIYVDPGKPSRSVLQQGGTGVASAEAIAGVLLLSMWLRSAVRERRLKRTAHDAVSRASADADQ